ncbi:hypothetical protein QYF36_020729 [Acer negundo]|nr:hypothetical protein QYF36_020729 [Acer negundo]
MFCYCWTVVLRIGLGPVPIECWFIFGPRVLEAKKGKEKNKTEQEAIYKQREAMHHHTAEQPPKPNPKAGNNRKRKASTEPTESVHMIFISCGKYGKVPSSFLTYKGMGSKSNDNTRSLVFCS